MLKQTRVRKRFVNFNLLTPATKVEALRLLVLNEFHTFGHKKRKLFLCVLGMNNFLLLTNLKLNDAVSLDLVNISVM